MRGLRIPSILLLVGIVVAVALMQLRAAPAVGRAVPDAQAAELRGGACCSCWSSTCPQGPACPAAIVVVLGSGTLAHPYGSKYCGGPNSCGDYFSAVESCAQ